MPTAGIEPTYIRWYENFEVGITKILIFEHFFDKVPTISNKCNKLQMKVYINADISKVTKLWWPLVTIGILTPKKPSFYLVNCRLESFSKVTNHFLFWFLVGKIVFQAKKASIPFIRDIVECKNTKNAKKSNSIMTPLPTIVWCLFSGVLIFEDTFKGWTFTYLISATRYHFQ